MRNLIIIFLALLLVSCNIPNMRYDKQLKPTSLYNTDSLLGLWEVVEYYGDTAWRADSDFEKEYFLVSEHGDELAIKLIFLPDTINYPTFKHYKQYIFEGQTYRKSIDMPLKVKKKDLYYQYGWNIIIPAPFMSFFMFERWRFGIRKDDMLIVQHISNFSGWYLYAFANEKRESALLCRKVRQVFRYHFNMLPTISVICNFHLTLSNLTG